MLIAFISMRWRFFKGRGGWNPTLSFFNCTSIFAILEGISRLFIGSWRIVVLPRPAEAPAILVIGVLEIAPFLAIFLYGRQKLFHVMARRFEDKRRKFDSAVIAELMDNTDIRVGQEWWVHHGKNLADEYPGVFDHRRNWNRGFIVKVEAGRYAVDVAVEQLPLDPTFSSARGGEHTRSQGKMPSRLQRQGSTRSRGKMQRQGSSKGSFLRRGRSSASLVWIDMPSSAKLKAEDLLKNAMDNLRLLDGQYVTHGLLATYVVCRDNDDHWMLL